jgi:dienelactone hydrolase
MRIARQPVSIRHPRAPVLLLLGLLHSLSWADAELRLPPLPVSPPLTNVNDVDAQGGPVHFLTSSPVSFDLLLDRKSSNREHAGRGHLYLPADLSTPVPAMVILHGSRGIDPSREPGYAKLLQQHGIASLVVDYYSARGITEDVPRWNKTLYVTVFDIVSDAYASLSFLASLPFIDPQRVGVIGFSWGGVASRFSMDKRIAKAKGGKLFFSLHADYYGPCQETIDTTATTGTPLLTVRGVLDASNSPAGCARREEELRHAGSAVKAYTLEAGHNWDTAEPFRFDSSAPFTSAACLLRYSSGATESTPRVRVLSLPNETSRQEQLRIRAAWVESLTSCMAYGYYKGGLPEMEAEGERILMDFLNRQLLQR